MDTVAYLKWKWRRVILTSRSPPMFGRIVDVDASSFSEIILALRLDNGSVTYVDTDAKGAVWDFDGGERMASPAQQRRHAPPGEPHSAPPGQQSPEGWHG